MEQVEQQVEGAIDKDTRAERAYEKYGWMILSASAILGIFAAVLNTVPPLYVFSSPTFEGAYPIMGALGTALVGFNVLALVMTLVPYKRGERWAWLHTLAPAPAVGLAVCLVARRFLPDTCPP